MLTTDDSPIDVTSQTATVTAQKVVEPAAKPPVTAAELPSAIKPLTITVQTRTGIRKLRGKPTVVPTDHLDVMVDGYARAWTRTEVGKPIRALAEFLPHEIPQLQAAVQAYRGDKTPPEFRSLPKGSQEDISKLQSM